MDKVNTPNSAISPISLAKTMKRPRLVRLLEALVLNDGITSKHVGSVTGASNSYEEISKLRRLGWVIFNTHHRVIDRDGVPCRFDRYHLLPNQFKCEHKVIKTESDH